MHVADEEMARKLADDIKARRTGLDNEDALAAGERGPRGYARALKYRQQDRTLVNGMVIGLTYQLGDPMNMTLAEAFIRNEVCLFDGCLARFSQEMADLPPDAGGYHTGWYWKENPSDDHVPVHDHRR